MFIWLSYWLLINSISLLSYLFQFQSECISQCSGQTTAWTSEGFYVRFLGMSLTYFQSVLSGSGSHPASYLSSTASFSPLIKCSVLEVKPTWWWYQEWVNLYFQFPINIVAWTETSLICPVAQLFPIQDPIPSELAVTSNVGCCCRSPSTGTTPQWHFTYISRSGTEHLTKASGTNFAALWWLRFLPY
jgi:hypothetical protein